MRLIDSHCHLQAERFEADLDLVLGGARLAGVERILVPGWNLESSRRSIALCERVPWLDAAAGIHPHDAARASDDDWAEVVALAADPRVVAIGETGLDYDRVFSPVDDQLRNLRRHLRLALDTGKPPILHVRSAAGGRDAQDSLLLELDAAGFGSATAAATFGGRPSGVIHSFSGPVDYARAVLDLGLAISISGLAFRTGEEATAEVAATVAPDRLLVETDAPYLSPPGAPRRRNEPEWVRVTAEWVRDRRGSESEPFGNSLVATYDHAFPRLTPRT
jgi:TatD DNase family protein